LAQYLDRDESFSASDDMNAPRTSATRSTSSVFSPRILTPSLTTSASGGDRFRTPSPPGFDGDQDDHDPDRPLPSVERDLSSSDDRSTSTVASPTASLDSTSTEPAEVDNAMTQEIIDMHSLRLTSPQTPQSLPHRASRTPSIHITPSAVPNGTYSSASRREDSLAADVAALSIKSHRADSLTTGLQESRSPSPSRRRRSGSGIRREPHQVESELPPEAFAHMVEVQEALASARALPKRLVAVLSSSNLYRENGSSIRKLYQQAKNLSEFELPSSRIVGLVGDSGVGKSSLINSLLDKSDLARAVSNSMTYPKYLQAKTKINRAAVAQHVHVLSPNIISTTGTILWSMLITSLSKSSKCNTRNFSELIATSIYYLKTRGVATRAMWSPTTNTNCRKSPYSPQQLSKRASGRGLVKCQEFYCRYPLNVPLQRWSSGHHNYSLKPNKGLSAELKNAVLGREN
jgi:hypothetical protein